jgi:uncharacterized cupredoxin-like copper-binding protein
MTGIPAFSECAIWVPPSSTSRGKPGEAGNVTRVIEVVAADNTFSLKSLQVKYGETVSFVVRNMGSIRTSC